MFPFNEGYKFKYVKISKATLEVFVEVDRFMASSSTSKIHKELDILIKKMASFHTAVITDKAIISKIECFGGLEKG